MSERFEAQTASRQSKASTCEISVQKSQSRWLVPRLIQTAVYVWLCPAKTRHADRVPRRGVTDGQSHDHFRLGPGRSDSDGEQSDDGIVAQCRHRFKRHVASALHGPFVALLQEDGLDEPDDGVVVGEDADDLGAPFDLAVEPLESVGGMNFGPVVGGETHVREHVVFGLIRERGELGQLGLELVGDFAPLGLRGHCAVLGEGGGHEGGDNPPAALAGVGERVANGVDPAALPSGVHQRGDGRLDALVGVRDG